MFSTKNFRSVLSLIAIMAVLIPATPSNAAGGPGIDRAGGPKDHIEVVLRADGAPSVGGISALTFEVTPLIDAPDLEIRWVVPPGVELLGAETDNLGPVEAHQTVTLQRQVRFQDAGTFKVAVGAAFRLGEGIQYAASGVLFFTIDDHGSRVSDMDPDARSPMHSKVATEVTSTALAPASTTAPNSDPCFNISGTLTRIERAPIKSGYAPDERKPVHNAVVEIRESDILFDDSYAYIATNNLGNFSWSFCDDDGWFDDELEIYIRIHAWIYVDGETVVEVEDSSFPETVYDFDSYEIVSEGGTHHFNLNLDVTQSAVFNIADAIYDAWTFWNANGALP